MVKGALRDFVEAQLYAVLEPDQGVVSVKLLGVKHLVLCYVNPQVLHPHTHPARFKPMLTFRSIRDWTSHKLSHKITVAGAYVDEKTLGIKSCEAEVQKYEVRRCAQSPQTPVLDNVVRGLPQHRSPRCSNLDQRFDAFP